MSVIDLCPGAWRGHWLDIELVCEYLEENAGPVFSLPDLTRALGGTAQAAAKLVIRDYMALGFVERVGGGPAPHPVTYRVLPHALPVGKAA
jgi:hypothetical protein